MTRYQMEMLQALDGAVDLYNTTQSAFIQEVAYQQAQGICKALGMPPPRRVPKQPVEKKEV